jgi:hypothetical protein
MPGYAEAGIRHYWLVELEPEVELLAYELAGPVYREAARLRAGVAELPGPIPLRVDVEMLR